MFGDNVKLAYLCPMLKTALKTVMAAHVRQPELVASVRSFGRVRGFYRLSVVLWICAPVREFEGRRLSVAL